MAHKVYILLWLLLWTTSAVFSQSLSINTIQEMNFGDSIFPGVEKTVLFTNSNAAEFEITGEPNRQVIILFQLPSVLNDQESTSLDIDFSSTDAGYNPNSADPMDATVFNPNNGATATLNSEGKLHVWIGATVIPLHTQTGNPYQGSLILDVSYAN